MPGCCLLSYAFLLDREKNADLRDNLLLSQLTHGVRLMSLDLAP